VARAYHAGHAQLEPEPLFAESPLVKIGRLSVVPLTQKQWDWFMG
jgi:hypothetical protein